MLSHYAFIGVCALLTFVSQMRSTTQIPHHLVHPSHRSTSYKLTPPEMEGKSYKEVVGMIEWMVQEIQVSSPASSGLDDKHES